MPRNTRRPARPQSGRIRPLIAAVLGAVLAVGGILVAPVAATAAPGDLVVQVEYLDGITNEPITDLQATIADRNNGDEWFYKLNVSYSCGPVQCASAVVRIAPQILDPYYGTQRFSAYASTSLPGNVVSTSAAAGQTVQLGTLAPGTSGSFQMTYRFQGRGVGVDPASFFPEGQVVPASVTLSATGLDPVTATDEITWHIATPDPRVSIASPDLARTESDYTYTLYMSASCQWERSTAGHGEPTYECARDYTVTDHLDEDAIFVSASPGAVHDPVTNTVTWTASGQTAAPGWGPLNSLGQPRTVTVRYPDSIVDGESCVVDITNRLDVSMTYLSGTAKTATANRTHRVNACEAFASAVLDGKSSTRDAGTATDALVWERQSGHYWYVRLANRANVPGVATVVDDELDQAGLPVYAVTIVGSRGSIQYTLDDGTTGTATDVTGYNAPTGRSITAATVVTAPLNGPNLEESSQTARTEAQVRYYYSVADDVPNEGWVRTNTASATMSYPNTDLADLDLGDASYTVTAVPRPVYFRPTLGYSVAGGGQPVIGTPVTYSLNASTADVEPGTPFEGQYVYVAPVGWDIIPNSAAIAGATDFSFEYKTVTISGQQRQAVYAARPAGTLWGANETWPTMTVQATPTSAVAGGSTGNAIFYMGDAGHNYGPNTAIWGNNGNFRFVDAPDLDGDGDVTESYAYVGANVTVGATTALNVLKEICYPDPTQPDGCEWRSNPDVPVPVSPTTTDITYRVTITNNGSTAQTGVVAYDVLPHVGDTGLTATTAGVSRGSTFGESLTSAQAGTGVTLTYSDATNPCRPEVFTGGPTGCSNTWNADADGAMSIRAAVSGTLGAGQSRSFTYNAAVVGDPVNGDIACNSVAIDSATTSPTEPRAVCARIVEADLAASAPARLPLQVDRPGVVPFLIANNSGATEAPAEVTLEVPAELTVAALSFDGWICTSEDGPAPISGGTTLTCEPTAGVVSQAEPLALNLPVIPVDGADDMCVGATVDAEYYDGVPANDATQACFQVIAGEPELTLSKDDGREAVAIGDEYTYTITVANRLVGESVEGATVTDQLPAHLQFVSATAGGTVTGQSETGAGGTVTWSLGALAPAAEPDEDGVLGDAPADSAAQVAVTVRVLQSAESVSTITNAATVSAADPADTDVSLTASDDDTDDVVRTAALSLTKSVTPETVIEAGTQLAYSFLVVNEGDVTLTDVQIDEQEFSGTGISAPVVTCPAGPLAPDADLTCTASYTVTQADIAAGGVTNSAVAAASAPEGLDDPESEVSTARVTVTPVPGISLVKSADVTDLVVDEEVTYSFVVTNTGNVALEDVSITEGLFTGSGELSDVVCADGAELLAIDDQVTCEATYVITQADVDAGELSNTAVAIGRGPGGLITSAPSRVDLPFDQAPGLALVKSADVEGIEEAGQEVEFRFRVTNTGNVTVTDVAVTEDDFTGSGTLSDIACDVERLLPGQRVDCRATYEVTQDDVDAGGIANTASASALPPGSQTAVPAAPSSVTLPFVGATSLALQKTGTPVDVDDDGLTTVKDRIRWTFVVTNDGAATLTGLALSDPMAGEIECAASELAPGETVRCAATSEYQITAAQAAAGEVVNVATASARGVGDVTADAEAGATVEIVPVPVAAAMDPLAGTGADSRAALTVAVLVLLAGAGLMVVARTRSRRA
ncbi:isopeptide-forming domain-containing fimbrial protein [Microbacterium sp. 179-I 3D4 NHS]|uniref:DUF7507 domain-containing protein n=1 Tax=Microbacterium sp. 179-I 3D4 NHS TaxID=3142381 RepID=UPI0039A038FD